ncbi:hypothetical protein [Shimia sediminis]|uniref:hypothetical protein n=1 Tax=Shimia sediminis TaxID=2497945 RepID=UPI000F8E7A82|nr:hypothetical protein [Shimia sediminis]
MSPVPASAYQVDCAILLCLAGGWPASAPCAHAKAVFIRRITPWPIEPPLQIWRCPMRAAMDTFPGEAPGERLYHFAFADEPHQSLPRQSVPDYTIPVVLNWRGESGEYSQTFRQLAQSISTENGTADIDISDPAFDFVRSIKVWNVMHYSHYGRGRDDECIEQSNITVGTYGVQGDFYWTSTGPGPVPSWVIPSKSCHPGITVRAVGVEWTDNEGNHGYEVVNY